jgi:hypothetical protein
MNLGQLSLATHHLAQYTRFLFFAFLCVLLLAFACLFLLAFVVFVLVLVGLVFFPTLA